MKYKLLVYATVRYLLKFMFVDFYLSLDYEFIFTSFFSSSSFLRFSMSFCLRSSSSCLCSSFMYCAAVLSTSIFEAFCLFSSSGINLLNFSYLEFISLRRFRSSPFLKPIPKKQSTLPLLLLAFFFPSLV